MLPRYVCPPWYRCKCYGRPVCKTTMLAHRNLANEKREAIGRGKFRWGPRVEDRTLTEVSFECQEDLAEHISDNEKDEFALVIKNGVAFEKKSLRSQEGEDAEQLGYDLGSDHAPVCEQELQRESDDSDDPKNSPTGLVFETETPFTSGSPIESFEDDVLSPTPNSPNADSVGTDSSEDGSLLENEEHENEFDAEFFEATEDVDPQFLSVLQGSGNVSVLEWVKDNEKWAQLFFKHGLKFTVMDSILRNLNAPVKYWKTVVSNICAAVSLKSKLQIFPVCPGHICYSDLPNSAETIFCHYCKSPKPDMTARTSVQYIPLLPRIQAMLMDQQACTALFQYHQTFQNDPGTFRDFFDSASYERICEMYGGSDAVSWDIFIAASTDGFQAYKNQTLDVWPILGILLNLAPDQRYSVKNVLPFMFIPDGQPSCLQSFLIPLINEVLSTLPDGVTMEFFDGSKRKVRLHLVWFSTDLDALTKVANLTGHNGKTPCRFCLIKGVYCQTSRHYYFPCSIRLSEGSTISFRFNPSSLPLRSSRDIKSAMIKIDDARTKSERADLSKETGIKGDSVLFQIPNFIPYVSFPVDVMHLFYNVQKHLLAIHTSSPNDAFCLTSREVEVLDLELVAFGDGVSGQMAPKPRKLSAFHSWKAAEHKSFTLSYYMVLLDGYLSDLYMNCLDLYVSIVELCFRTVLAESELQQLSKLAVTFIKQFEKHFMGHDLRRIKMSTYVMHLILHLADGIRENGPLVNSSQYWVERYIGWIVNRLHAKRLPAASLRNSAVFNESYKMLYPIASIESEDSALQIGENFRLVSPIRFGDLDSTDSGGPDLRRLISRYLVRKYDGMTVREAKLISNERHTCRFWSRVKFRRNGHGVIQSADVAPRRSQGRPSHYVATEMDVTESSADVYYGQLLLLIEVNLAVTDQDMISRFPCLKERHSIAVIKWARPLSKGKQHQVFIRGRSDAAFSTQTMEDVTIIKRLVAVVQHAVPSVRKEVRGINQRAQQRTYFIDSDTREDYLLTDRKRSIDGVNRVLKGLANVR